MAEAHGMNVVMVHYHLNPGGVTQVVKNHIRALDTLPAETAPQRVVLCHGGPPAPWFAELAASCRRLQLAETLVERLGYDPPSSPARPPDSEALAAAVQAPLDHLGLDRDHTLLHVHNHSLGKNTALPGAIARLAGEGLPVLLQIHDFAEDFRSANYARLVEALACGKPDQLPQSLYPQAEHIHYAVLNGRDARILARAGVASQRLHSLPNPVVTPARGAEREPSRELLGDRFGVPLQRRYVVYPVRGIRRKNLGEALLWAAAAGDAVTVGVTLPPLNPLEVPGYDRWRRLASDLGLPVCFDVGADGGLTLDENLAASDFVLTTSLAEGFGMVFLESGLAGRPLVGRDLPEVTEDFVEHGMTFAGLRQRLDVPIGGLDPAEVVQEFFEACSAALRRFHRATPSQEEFQREVDRRVHNGCIDFGDLGEEHQAEVLRLTSQDARRRAALLDLNPLLDMVRSAPDDALREEVTRNAGVVDRQYALVPSGRRLAETYRRVVASPRRGLFGLEHGYRVLDEFLTFSRFRPLRA